MALSLLPTGIALVDGTVDGLLRQNDLNNGRTAIHLQWATWYEAVGLLGGIGAALLGAHPDIADPFIYASGGLLASKFGQWALTEAQGSSATSTSGGPGSRAGVPSAFSAQRVAGQGGPAGERIQYGTTRDATAGVL